MPHTAHQVRHASAQGVWAQVVCRGGVGSAGIQHCLSDRQPLHSEKSNIIHSMQNTQHAPVVARLNTSTPAGLLQLNCTSV